MHDFLAIIGFMCVWNFIKRIDPMRRLNDWCDEHPYAFGGRPKVVRAAPQPQLTPEQWKLVHRIINN